MRRIELSEFREEDGSISLQNRIRGSLQHGMNWYADMEAQDLVYERLNKALGNEHILLCNATIPTTGMQIPLVLIGPQGVRTMIAVPAKGVFRAKGDAWLKFGSSGKRFASAKPNYIHLVQGYAQTVLQYLRNQGYPLPEVEAVLIFTNPKTHVDSIKPEVRIVLTDAIDHYAVNLLKFQPIMDIDDIREVKDALIQLPSPKPEVEPEEEPAAPEEGAMESMPAPRRSRQAREQAALTPRKPRPIGGGLFGLSTRELAVLGVMAFFQIIILIVMVILVVTDLFYS